MTKHRGPGPGPGGPWGGPWGGGGRAQYWGGGFGPGGPGGGPRGRGRRRARRGDVRAALLVLLAEEPRNGYQLIQELAERSGGMWQPSPGAVYPALAQLEDEGLVRSEETDGRRSFRLTDEGSRYVEEHRERLGTPWKAMAGEGGEGLIELRDLVGQLAAAVLQVAHAGTDAQVGEAKRLLTEARRRHLPHPRRGRAGRRGPRGRRAGRAAGAGRRRAGHELPALGPAGRPRAGPPAGRA